MTFQLSSDDFPIDLSILQGFIPIDSVSSPLSFLLSGADVRPSSPDTSYPALKTTTTISFVRTFVPNIVVTTELYDIISQQINGNISFINNNKTEFFIGLPLHNSNGGDQNVDVLLEKVFFEEFGIMP